MSKQRWVRIMSPEEFREALKLIGFSQTAFARSVGYTSRQVRRWAAGDAPVPFAVSHILTQLRPPSERPPS
jgi:DNA-binding transcriptional regulator YiaG